MTRFEAIPGVSVVGTATAFPRDVDPELPEMDNEEAYRALLGPSYRTLLAERGEDVDLPERRYGVRRRQWVGPPGGPWRLGVSELAIEAARRALADAGIAPGEVDLIVVGTSTPDRLTSSVSARVAKALGLGCATFDVRAGGAAALHGWLMAAALLRSGPRTAIVVGAEVGSPLLDPADHEAFLVYADGAGAVVLRRDDGPSGLVGAVLGTTAVPGVAFTVPGPLPPTVASVEAGEFRWQRPDRVYLDGLAGCWNDTTVALREAFPGVEPQWFAPYRATRRQVEAAARSLGVPLDRTASDVGAHGCVGGAGPLVALHELASSGRLRRGDVVASAAVAGGVVSHGMLWRW